VQMNQIVEGLGVLMGPPAVLGPFGGRPSLGEMTRRSPLPCISRVVLAGPGPPPGARATTLAAA